MSAYEKHPQIVNSVFTSNTYILSVEGKDGHVLIDIGDIAPIKQCVQEKCGTVQALFLTHTHTTIFMV